MNFFNKKFIGKFIKPGTFNTITPISTYGFDQNSGVWSLREVLNAIKSVAWKGCWIYNSGTFVNWSPVTNRSGFTPGPDARLAIGAVRPKRMQGTVVNSQCDWAATTYVYVQVSYDNQATWETVFSRSVYLNPTSGCTSSSGTYDVQVTTEKIATHLRVYAPNRHNNVTHNVKITEWYTQ